MPSTPAIDAREITKRYGARVAVDSLSFSAQPGEILGVLGPNGAGKTSAIRVLTTMLAPTAGTFAIAGIRHDRPSDIRRAVGVLPESSGYPEHQTGLEYLRYHARLYGQSRASAASAAHRLLERVALGDRGASTISAYSRGMRQRLGIARALVNEPRVVFLDEPTLGLDPAGQRQVLELVRHIVQEDGATVLVCTHLLAEVEETCSRVIILNEGRLAAAGTVAEVSRLAGAERRATLRVAHDDTARALAALVRAGSVAGAASDGAPGVVAVTLERGAGEDAMNDGLRALADARVPVLFFELEGARLSDAFLELTRSWE
jgi:ABC-2 type transport system ATP-binding protein